MTIRKEDFLKYESADKFLSKNSREKINYMTFGVYPLDQALTGILNTDLVIIGGISGFGKTELATIIAMNNAKRGKKVFYLALEAEEGEIEDRIKYKETISAMRRDDNRRIIRMTEWKMGEYGSELDKYEENAYKNISENIKNNLFVKYRTGDYTVSNFEYDFDGVADIMDLVIIDHLHYFDFDDENELRALRKIVKKIRDRALIKKKPIILLAHLRKQNRFHAALVPGLEEFHGTSDITKIATKVITMAHAFDQEKPKHNLFPTYFRICKNRIDGSVTRYILSTLYDIETAHYDENYLIGTLRKNDQEFLQLESGKEPYWFNPARKDNFSI